MAKRFLKLNLDSDKADFLALNHPNAFILLYFIARRARRSSGKSDGLNIGECHLGDWKSVGLSRQNYRTALKVLVAHLTIKILETNRTRKKSTTGLTTEGTKVKLLNSDVWDINSEVPNHRSNHCLTTDQPLPNHEQEREEREEREDHPSIPSNSDGRTTDDFFSKGKIEICPRVFLTQEELTACVRLKGDVESVKRAIEFIQSSPKRKHEIADWPNALATWKIENRAKKRIQERFSQCEKLCAEFCDFKSGRGWRCYIHHDRQNDQKGLLFESESSYQEALFVALADGKFEEKCEDFIKRKKMRLIS